MSAARNGDETVVDLLLRAGARSGSVDKDGNTAIGIANKFGHIGVASRLKATNEAAGQPPAQVKPVTPAQTFLQSHEESIFRPYHESATARGKNERDKDSWKVASTRRARNLLAAHFIAAISDRDSPFTDDNREAYEELDRLCVMVEGNRCPICRWYSPDQSTG